MKERLFRREHFVAYLFLFLFVGGGISLLYFMNAGFTSLVVYNQVDQSEFDLGTYVNTTWNGSAVVLSLENVSGIYISKVFDAGADAIWNNLIKVQSVPNLEILFAVDGGGDLYSSVDTGVTWTMSKENYGRTSSTSDMFSDNNYLYILTGTNKEVFKSIDFGITWDIINDTFSTNSFLVGASDNENNLYVATGPGEVFKSTNNGSTWSLLGDFNSGTNDAKGITINSSDDIYIVDGAGDVYSSVNGGSSWTKVNDGYGGTTGTDGMVVDSNDNLYILINSDVYSSIDSGVTWTKINDDFSPYSSDGMEISVDSNDNLWIADGVGGVFKSTNSGVDWTEIGDCNNAESNNPKGLTNFIQFSSLTYQVQNCSESDCSDGVWQDVDLDNINLIGQYFQYKIDFISSDSSISPNLERVSVDYDLINQAPLITLVEPQAQLYTP